jgi:hypothetical protein
MTALMRFGTEAAGPLAPAAPAHTNLPANEIFADGSGGAKLSASAALALCVAADYGTQFLGPAFVDGSNFSQENGAFTEAFQRFITGGGSGSGGGRGSSAAWDNDGAC